MGCETDTKTNQRDAEV